MRKATKPEDHDADYVRELVASNFDAELTRQRWSRRSAAMALGLTPMYVNRRAAGDVDISATDLFVFAEFLEIPISKFYEGIEKAPVRGGTGASLPDLDSNQEPAGSMPPLDLHELARVTPLRTGAPFLALDNKTAIITELRAS